MNHLITLFHSLPLFLFFFNDTATTEIYTLSLHDALPIYPHLGVAPAPARRIDAQEKRTQPQHPGQHDADRGVRRDRKSTRLNSSHLVISYAVFCLKKKKIAYCNMLVLKI